MTQENVQALRDIINRNNMLLALAILFFLGVIYVVLGKFGGPSNIRWRDVVRELTQAIVANIIPVALLFVLSYFFLSYFQPPAESTAERYGVTITDPKNGTKASNSLRVSGDYETIPQDAKIVLFVVEGADIYPQGYATLNEADKTWSGGINNLGGEVDQGKVIQAAVVGKEGQVLIDYYNEIGPQVGWTPLHQLTSDIVFSGPVTVIRQ